MHTSPSGKSYIGQTCNYKKRCNDHQNEKNKCTAFKNAIDKYGWDNFTHEILLDGLTLDEANYWEEFCIKEFNTFGENGYNLRTGGLNSNLSEETKNKISIALIGRVFSENHRESLSMAVTGVKREPLSEERKQWLSNFNKGKTLSFEHRNKIATANTGKQKSDECKLKYSRNRYIKTYEKIIANPDKIYGVNKGSENCYRVMISIDGKTVYLGSFMTEQAAFDVYKQKAYERYLEALKE
jgi:group I intron endonuclease